MCVCVYCIYLYPRGTVFIPTLPLGVHIIHIILKWPPILTVYDVIV